MRILFWKQPFAGLMLHGKVETRTWNTNYRGEVLICASKTPYSPAELEKLSGDLTMEFLRLGLWTKQLFSDTCIYGKAIAVGELVECRPLEYEDFSCVKFNPDLYAHVYDNVRRIEPFPLRGKQGFYNAPDEVIQKIKFI